MSGHCEEVGKIAYFISDYFYKVEADYSTLFSSPIQLSKADSKREIGISRVT